MTAITLMISSCDRNEKCESIDTDKSIVFDVDEDHNISSIVETITYIPFEDSHRHVMREVT